MMRAKSIATRISGQKVRTHACRNPNIGASNVLSRRYFAPTSELKAHLRSSDALTPALTENA